MTEAELRALIRPGGESETVEYKRLPERPEDLAKSLVALSNTRGGTILVGVDDGGRITGFSEPKFEECVASVARDKVSPPIAPAVDRYRIPEGEVAVIHVEPGPDGPYARVHEEERAYLVQVGTTRREADSRELLGLLQAAGRIQADETPVGGTSARSIEGQPLRAYLERVHRRDIGALAPRERRLLLTHLGFLKAPAGPATLGGVLLFTASPQDHIPEALVIVARFSGADVASGLEDRIEIAGRLPDMVKSALRTLRASLRARGRRRGGRLASEGEIPAGALREAIVNALVHRDYTLRGRPVRILVFETSVEIRSPGKPPNTMTVERMMAGSASVPRNPMLFTAMAHLGYVQKLGMGVRSIVETTRRLGRQASVLVDTDETVVKFPRRA
jgi:ATP-dependent DNA helicase RecG